MERTIGVMDSTDSLPVDRRTFMSVAGVSAGGLALCLAGPASVLAAPLLDAPSALSGPPVGTVFLDRPYVDMSGLAEPYIPPTRISPDPSRAQAWNYHPAFHISR